MCLELKHHMGSVKDDSYFLYWWTIALRRLDEDILINCGIPTETTLKMMYKAWPEMGHITAEGLWMWKTDYYLIITANLLVQPKWKAPKTWIITSSDRKTLNPLSYAVWNQHPAQKQHYLSFGREIDPLRQRMPVITAANVWCLMISQRDPRFCDSIIANTRICCIFYINTRGSPSSGLFLLSGLLNLCEFCLMEFWDGNGLWQQDGSGEILIITFGFFYHRIAWHTAIHIFYYRPPPGSIISGQQVIGYVSEVE